MPTKRNKFKQNVSGKSLSSTAWLNRHINDQYVHMAKEAGYRSRAAYKLLQICEKFPLLNRDTKNIIDLGCAPGGWLQVLREKMPNSNIIGVDLQAVAEVPGANIIQGNIFDDETIAAIKEIIKENKFDLILSDMAAAACGTPGVDHLRSIALCEAVLEFANENLNVNGSLIMKVIRGGEEHELQKILRNYFSHVKQFKPEASYKSSAEFYFVCLKLKPCVSV